MNPGRRAWAAVSVGILAAVPFIGSLNHPLFADDYIHISRIIVPGWSPADLMQAWVLRASDAATWWTPTAGTVPYFRPLASALFALDYAVWGSTAAGYHVTNLALHVVTTLIVLALARRLLASELAAWIAAAAFALHPCHSEAVLWASGRADLLAGLWSAAAVLVYVSGPASLARALPTAGCVALALSSKEAAIVLPAILLAYDVTYRREVPWRVRVAGPVAAGLVGLAYLAIRADRVGLGIPPLPFAYRLGDEGFFAHLLLSPIFYLLDLVLFLPVDPIEVEPFWMAHKGWLMFVGGVALLLLARTVRKADPKLVLFGGAWCVLALSPALTIAVGERFLYLPSVGYCLILGSASQHAIGVLKRRDIVAVAAVALLMAVISASESLAFGVLAKQSRIAIDDALAAIDGAPADTNLAVVDVPAASVLGFLGAVQVERPRRALNVEIVSVAPHFLRVTPDFQSTVQWVDARTLEVRALNRPYLESYLERALLAGGTVKSGASIDRSFFTVDVLQATGASVQSMRVRFAAAAVARTLILRGNGFRLEVLKPEASPIPRGEPAGASRAFPHAPPAASRQEDPRARG